MKIRERVAQFEILMEPDEGGFHAWCPALEGCHSFGATRDEARENIKEAIELWLDDGGVDRVPERESITVNLP